MPKAVLAILTGLLCGCAGQPSSMIASTSPLPPNVRGTVPASGDDCQYSFLGLIPLTASPNTQGALNEAKHDADSDVLTDVTVDHTSGYYLLFSNHCVHVRGLGVPRAVTRSAATEQPSHSFKE